MSVVPDTPILAPRHSKAPDLLCVALAEPSPDALLHALAALPSDVLFVELRLDALTDPLAALPQLTLRAQETGRTLLATCRPKVSGGQFAGTAQEELNVLLAAAYAGLRWVDLSLESAEVLGSIAIAQLRSAGARVLVSFHDFETMDDPPTVLARIAALAPDLAKIVPTARTLDDSLDLLRFVRETATKARLPLVAIAMGEAGVVTRLLGPRAGSCFTFAAASAANATAPGQLSAPALTDLYRIRELTPATRLFGVAGSPVHSSLSPLMFNTVFRAKAVDAAYVPLLTDVPAMLFRAAQELPLDGFSVTMPLKQAILPWLSHMDPLAARIGAVNTVHRTATGEFHGYNTDADGIVGPLERRLSLRGARVLVLGAGGAARAAVFGCVSRGAKVFIANRSIDRAAALAREAGAAALAPEVLLDEAFDVLIHATPAGMHGNPEALPPYAAQLKASLVFDLVYNPAETPLLALARERGLVTIPGLEMFIQQGARQYEIWTGQPAPLALMEATVQRALTVR